MSFRARNYALEQAEAQLHRIPAAIHPLQLDQSRAGASSSSRHSVEFAAPALLKQESSEAVVVDDPLKSIGEPELQADPLVPKIKNSRRVARNSHDEQFEAAAADWNSYKIALMQRFASSGNISVSLTNDLILKDHKVRSSTSTHLQQLEEPDLKSFEDFKVVTQQEYVTRLKDLNEEIAGAWANEERVSALKLTIKVAKILSDTSVPQFYPTLFVLVTDIMENVGALVWNRIKQKTEINGDLPVNFSYADVSEEAKDTCRNWFAKIGAIKELLPRIYLEIAILRCMHFLPHDPVSTFQRLSMMIRGLGDPVASAYAHVYLSRKGLALIPSETAYLVSGLHDFSTLIHRALGGAYDKKLGEQHIQKHNYLCLLEPMFEWSIRCLFKRTKQEGIQDLVVALCGKREKNALKPLCVLLHYLLKELPATFVGNHSIDIARLVKGSQDISISQHANFVMFGKKLCDCPPPRELRLQVLNDVWKTTTKYTSLEDHVEVANAFVEYILQCCSETELVIVLNDLKSRLSGVIHQKVLSAMESIAIKLIESYDLKRLLTMEAFAGIVDVFRGESRINVYKSVLSSVSRNNTLVQDPVTQNFLFEAAKVLHDSLDSLSTDDDRRQISRLVFRYVHLVDYGRDLENHLEFLVDCRASFHNMDIVKVEVVHASNQLAVATLKNAKGSHSRQSLQFVKACITFNEISIPSIASFTMRLKLFIETGEVALMNGLLSHTVSLLKSGILCFQDYQAEEKQSSQDDELLSIFLNLCSFLIVVPGDPELGALFFVRGVLNLLDSKPWLLKGRRISQLLGGILQTISTLSQDWLPYHVETVQIDSNDILYFGDSDYQEDMAGLAGLLVDRIVAVIEQETNLHQQGYMLLDACNVSLLSFKGLDGEQTAASFLKKAEAKLSKENSYLVATKRLVNKHFSQEP